MIANQEIGGVKRMNGEHLTIHDGIFCNNCKMPLIGKRFKCILCPDYDLCEVCEKNGIHRDHTLIRFAKTNLTTPEEQLMYMASFCNYCNDPIVGLGFKCKFCHDFDLCNRCMRIGIHREHKLDAFFSTLKKGQLYVHQGINCNICSRPVIGIRFKCSVCPDFNLCVRCQANRFHNKHSMIRITKKNAKNYG